MQTGEKSIKYSVGDVIEIKGVKGKIINSYIKNHKKYYDIECQNCNTVFSKNTYEISKERGWCPVCCNITHIVIKIGFNDMWTTDPDIAEQLLDPNDGYTHNIRENVYLDWKCKICGTPYSKKAYPKTIAVNYNRKVPCKFCSDGFSFPNKFVFGILTEAKIDFEEEKKFDWSDSKIYDFYLKDNHKIIEVQGKQHYEDNHFDSLDKIQMNDLYKKTLALKNGFSEDDYIYIDARNSNGSFLIQNMKNSSLSTIIDFDKINLSKILNNITNSLFSETIRLLKGGLYPEEVSDKLNIALTTVYNYIRRADDYGIYSYDFNESEKNRRKKSI